MRQRPFLPRADKRYEAIFLLTFTKKSDIFIL